MGSVRNLLLGDGGIGVLGKGSVADVGLNGRLALPKFLLLMVVQLVLFTEGGVSMIAAV